MTAPALTIEQRVQAIEDREAIQRILIDYAGALDARDADGYADLFAADGEWITGDIVRKGREEIRALIRGIYKSVPADFVNRESFELVFNPRIAIDGDRATAKSSHVVFRRAPNGSPLPILFGRYEDEFVREDGAWKIARRTDFPLIPTAEEWGAVLKARAQIAG